MISCTYHQDDGQHHNRMLELPTIQSVVRMMAATPGCQTLLLASATEATLGPQGMLTRSLGTMVYAT